MQLLLFLLHFLQKELVQNSVPRSVRSFEEFSHRWQGFLKNTETDWKLDRLAYLERKYR